MSDSEDAESLDSAQHQKSDLAEELADLKETILRVAAERDRLPQPLFWSLFRSRVDSIRKTKELRRVVSEELGGIGSDE